MLQGSCAWHLVTPAGDDALDVLLRLSASWSIGDDLCDPSSPVASQSCLVSEKSHILDTNGRGRGVKE